MRILHVSSEHPPLQIFGLGRYVCDLSRELARQGHSVHVLTNSAGGGEQDVEDHGVSIHRVDFPPPPKPPDPGGPVMAFNLHLAQRANALGRQGVGDPEVIVSHDWLTALAAHRLARRWDVPHVWTVHDTVHGKRFGRIEDVEDRLAYNIESWAAQAAGLVLVNSRAIREEILKVYGADGARTQLLHCGLAAEAFDWCGDVTRLQAFRSVLAGSDELLITYSGRLDIEKGLDTLISAFSLLRRTLPKARLAIAGRGMLQDTIEQHIGRLGLEGAVHLCGYLKTPVLKYFYRASDIHVCPSHYEPFGLVAAEAMAAGTPVVVSATGGLTDIVSSGEVGRTFRPKDTQALADVLLELARNPELRIGLGRAGRRHVREHFSWSILADSAAALYGSAAPGEN